MIDLPTSPEALETAQPETSEAEKNQQRALIKSWLSKIERAKKKWEPDFKRMRSNMEFVSGLQWVGQETIETNRYVNNITLRAISQKVAILYAKNPKAVAEPRKRMLYQVWDGQIDTLLNAMMIAEQQIATVGEILPEISAILNDWQAGNAQKQLLAKVCETLQIVYQYQVDKHRPDFKEQFKQLVRRTVICGVGYVRPIYCQPNAAYTKPKSIEVDSSLAGLAGRVSEVVRQIQESGKTNNDERLATLNNLATAMGGIAEDENLGAELSEKIEFDFPQATSVIPDPNCRQLKEFVAAGWIAIEYPLPREDVNAIFGVDVKTNPESQPQREEKPDQESNNSANDIVCVYEVLDKRTKTRFFICKGYEDYLVSPEYPKPSVDGFWNVVALTFNDIEVDPSTQTSIFPPSDVQLMKPIQMEWNRTRDSLKAHRRASAPRYLIRHGMLTEEDEQALVNGKEHELIRIKGGEPGQDLSKIVSRLEAAPIDPALYDTAPLEQDMMLGAGVQQANLGAAQPNVTATVGSIAEQSRMNVSASNVDDLDACLTRLAQMCGEMIFQTFSPDTVMRIAGPGAAWPMTDEMRTDLLNEILLKVEAASSGRPNKAVDIQNWTQLAPILQAAGVNPAGLVEETVKRLDDGLDVSKMFPITPDTLSGPIAPVAPGQAAPSAPPASQKGAALA